MFEELKDWLEKEEICISEPDENPAEMHETVSRLYPSPGGILSTIPRAARGKYKSVAVDGLNRCIQMLDSIRDYNIGGYFIEMSACSGSCVEGPGSKASKRPSSFPRTCCCAILRRKPKPRRSPPKRPARTSSPSITAPWSTTKSPTTRPSKKFSPASARPHPNPCSTAAPAAIPPAGKKPSPFTRARRI